MEIEPRVLLGFEDAVMNLPDDSEPDDAFHFPLNFTWALPPLPQGPDLLVLATELAGIGGPELPLEVSATDSFPSATDAPERTLRIVAHQTGVAAWAFAAARKSRAKRWSAASPSAATCSTTPPTGSADAFP